MLPELVAAALPIAWLLIRNGYSLVPGALDWLSLGDSTMHLGGWLFFSREPWQWPPARIATWLVPAGTTIGLADAIPLVAMPLKVLASWLAKPFQYFGLWFALCLILQGVLASRLLAELGAGERLRALGGALAGFSPVLWQRFDCGHFSLTAQWAILASFLAWTRYFGGGGRFRYLIWLAAIPVLTASIHPYLTLICGALLAAAVLASWRFGSRRVVLGSLVVVTAALTSALVAYGCGFLGSGARLDAGPWRDYSTDLAALLNPETRSRLVPALYDSGSNGEGFAYLGLGVLVLAVIGLVAAIVRRLGVREGAPDSGPDDPHGLRPLWLACGCLALVACLPSIRVAGLELLTARRATSILELALGPFRANGRLVWPLHLLALVAVLSGLRPLAVKREPFTWLMAVVIALQAVELGAGGPAGETKMSAEASKDWREAYPGHGKLRILPVYLRDGSQVYCGDVHGDGAWIFPAFLAATSAATFDSGYVTRLNETAALATCAQGERVLEDFALEADTVYLMRRSLARRVSRRGFECRQVVKSLWACTGLRRGLGTPATSARPDVRSDGLQ
jgi:hypothetical protein